MSRARERREELRIPKRELAARLGISTYELSRVESGSARPSVVMVARMALLLGVDATALFDLHPCECGRCDVLIPRGRTFARGHHDKSAASARARRERRRELGIPEEKVCIECGRRFTRRRSESTKKWLRRRWCRATCWRSSKICRTAPHLRQW